MALVARPRYMPGRATQARRVGHVLLSQPGVARAATLCARNPKVAEASRERRVNPACAASQPPARSERLGTAADQSIFAHLHGPRLLGKVAFPNTRLLGHLPLIAPTPRITPSSALHRISRGQQLELQWVHRDWAESAWIRRSQESLFRARAATLQKSPRHRISALVVTPCSSRSSPGLIPGNSRGARLTRHHRRVQSAPPLLMLPH